MNHAQIAKEALNMRLATLSSNVANVDILDELVNGITRCKIH